jgi:16S rRNA processing protein RimM
MIRVGLILGAHGVHGSVKVMTLTDFPDRFDVGSELFVAGQRRRVEAKKGNAPSRPGAPLILSLSGLDDRAAAERLEGAHLEVPEEDLHPLPAWTWYRHQLVGLDVVTAGGRDLGKLTEVMERPANDVWVAMRDSSEHLIPAIRDAVLSVDLEAGRVVIADWVLQVEDA